MKRLLLLILLFLAGCSFTGARQWRHDIQQALGGSSPLATSQIIQALGVDSINATGYTATGKCCFRLQKFEANNDLNVYEVIFLNNRSSLELTDYKGRLLSAKYDDVRSPGRYLTYDHNAWSNFAQSVIGSEERWRSPNLHIFTPEESQAYYRLINVIGKNEYGWICEYGTVGFPPEQREAILVLLKKQNAALIREVLHGPNIEGKMYAADALIYLDKQGISLQNDDQQIIDALRNSKAEVQTCGNAGSYKIYLTPAHQVLSDSAIARIPKMYDALAKLGYSNW